MKKLILIFALAAMTGCGGPSVKDVKPGMTTTEVQKLLGAPAQKQEMAFGIEWWLYGDNSLVIVAQDTVVKAVPDKKKMQEEMMNAINEGLEEAGKKSTE